MDLPDRTAGVDYPTGTTAQRLTQVGADVIVDGERVTATPPSWRPDIRQPADLVEEVLRLEGLEAIPSVLPQAPAGRGLTPVQKRRRAIGKSLALNGYVEILPTPFLPAGVFDQWGLPRRRRRAAPPRMCSTRWSPTARELATTLLPGLLEALARNVSRGAVDVALFAHRAGGRADVGNPCRRAYSERSQAHRRRDRDTRCVAAAPAGARRCGADRPA